MPFTGSASLAGSKKITVHSLSANNNRKGKMWIPMLSTHLAQPCHTHRPRIGTRQQEIHRAFGGASAQRDAVAIAGDAEMDGGQMWQLAHDGQAVGGEGHDPGPAARHWHCHIWEM